MEQTYNTSSSDVVDRLHQELQSALAELVTSEDWQEALAVAARFHQYSFSNTQLIWAQAKERGFSPTRVTGYRTWRDLERQVRRGERGLSILAPIIRNVEVDDGTEERRVVGFRPVHVFDISQTDGPPLPEVTPGPIETEVATHPTVAIEGSGAVVEDCVLIQPSFTESVGVWYEADLQNGPDGWRVTDLDIRSSQGCVPAALASAAIAGYEGYLNAEDEFWDPPDPTHPFVTETMAEPRLSNIRELLERHQEQGVAFRSDPITHPEVVEIRSPTELVILDCYEPSPTDGLYDLATGERLTDNAQVAPGQRNLRSAVMVLEDGQWKASDFQGQVDFECDFAPTDRGLPSV